MVLSGVRVVEFSAEGSAEYCGKVLAELGAEVVKVEPPKGGTFRRGYGPFIGSEPSAERSAGFIYLNAGKRSITLDRVHSLGQEIAAKLAASADIVLVDHDDPVSEGSKDCHATRVVFFGTSHPAHRHFKITDIVAYALSGYLYVDGDGEREPLKGGGEQPAHTAANYAVLAILAQRLRDGGQPISRRIEVPTAECMATMHWYTTVMWTYSRIKKLRIGNRLDLSHPVSLYKCLDGWVAFASGGNDAWARLTAVIGRPELADDPRFADGWSRLQHADEVDEVITAYTATRTRLEVMTTMQEVRVTCGLVSYPNDLLEDLQYNARSYWKDLNQPGIGLLKTCGPPFQSEQLPFLEGLKAPALGEHTFTILDELGYAVDEQHRLRWDGIV